MKKYKFNVGDVVMRVDIGGNVNKYRQGPFPISCREVCRCDPLCDINLYYGEVAKTLRRTGPFEEADLILKSEQRKKEKAKV